MAIGSTLTKEQNKLQTDARNFAQNVLAPDVREAHAGWIRCAGSSSPRTRRSFLFDPKATERYAGTRVEEISKWKQATSYAERYLAKVEQFPEGLETGRIWGI